MMNEIDEQGRPEPPLAASELDTLVGFLEFHRATLAWKCSGLDDAGFRATLGSSSMTLAGMLKHLALVEDQWFSQTLHENDDHPPFDRVDWDADIDWDWNSALDDRPDELLQLWRDAVERSRRHLDTALDAGGLDQLAKRTLADGQAPNLRWILTHMVEEYSRHNGHADLLRESIDGMTGE